MSTASQPSKLQKVVTFLSKLGGILGSIAPEVPVVTGILSLFIKGAKAQSVIQTVQSDFGAALGVVSDAEAMGQALELPGAQKLIAASGPMARIILSSTAFAGLKIANPELFNQGAKKVADGFADCYNAVHPDAVQTAHP